MKKKMCPTENRTPIERIATRPGAGLSGQQAAARAAAGWANGAGAGLEKTTGQILRDNLLTPFNLLFAFLALCLFLVGSYRNMMFLGIVLCNTAISTLQELRVKRKLARISLLSQPTALAVRDGRPVRLPADQLVLDDVVQLQAGDQVPADALLLSGQLEVDESLLTGEADSLLRQPGDRLLSGSAVVAGSASIRLEAVGPDAFAARVAGEARTAQKKPSQLICALDRLLRGIGLILLPVAALLFARQLFVLKTGLAYAVASTVGAVLGMIPEGLYLLTSLALAVGALNLTRRHTLVHQLACIENLARVDLLCLDKTGTLTQGSLKVEQLLPLPGGPGAGRLAALLGSFAHSGTDANATTRALQQAFADAGLLQGAAELPFSSARKYSARWLGGGALLLGAPELLAGQDAQLQALLAGQLQQGRRALLLAGCRCSGLSALAGPGPLPPLRPLGLVLLGDCIRPDAAATLAYFKAQGVQIKLISGDSPAAVCAIAGRAGVENADSWVDLSTLSTEEELAAAARQYTVFGRATPQQKRGLIRAMKQQGHTVAMTGDGVNDLLALREADCSVAMAAGSEAAQQAAQIVLLNSDFSALPAILAEGRRVINNIQRSAALFLVKNILSLSLALALLFIAMPYPFTPLQLSLLSALTIGVPSFLLTLEPCYDRVAGGSFLRQVLLRALPGGLADLLCLLAAMGLSCLLGLPQRQVSTLCVLLAGLVGLLVLAQSCRPMNRWRAALCLLLTAAYFLCTLLGGPLLDLAWPCPAAFGIFALLALAAPLLLRGLTLLTEQLQLLAAGAGRRRAAAGPRRHSQQGEKG